MRLLGILPPQMRASIEREAAVDGAALTRYSRENCCRGLIRRAAAAGSVKRPLASESSS
jgi:hypothetical protein